MTLKFEKYLIKAKDDILDNAIPISAIDEDGALEKFSHKIYLDSQGFDTIIIDLYSEDKIKIGTYEIIAEVTIDFDITEIAND